MSDLARVPPYWGGLRQRAPCQHCSCCQSDTLDHTMKMCEREAELGGEVGASPAPVLQRPTTSFCLLTPSLCSTPEAGRMSGLCNTDLRHPTPPPQPVAKSFSFVTYISTNTHTNCTAPSHGQALLKRVWIFFFR